MTREQLRALLEQAPLVASVQASPGSPLAEPGILLACAKASMGEGVKVLRLEGVESIRTIRAGIASICIGLIKKTYPESAVYITPTPEEVQALIDLGCEIIAFDATPRSRPGGSTVSDLIQRIRAAGRLSMADCDSLESAVAAAAAGADIISTTLAGYTPQRLATPGPDLELLRQVRFALPADVILLAEGRFAEPNQLTAALSIGADGVVIGGALNDPVKQTRRFMAAAGHRQERVGAVDIGGTWLRFGVFSVASGLEAVERIALPADPKMRLHWISEQLASHDLKRVGISTGGVVDPQTCTVVEAKAIIPGHVGTEFDWPGMECFALNDGLATAWGHAMHPRYAGTSVATLALGTGVGCGFVKDGVVQIGHKGGYPRLNDLPIDGCSFEDLLGGAALTANPSADDRAKAQRALAHAVDLITALWMPDHIVVCGGVGLANWLELPKSVERSPYGREAGLVGAGWLAIQPPELRT